MKRLIPIFLACIVAFSCTDSLERGLVIHSSFDKDASDAGPNGYHGKLVGAAISKDAAVGEGCVTFDGIDDYVEYPSDKVYFEGDYSISLWAKADSARLWERFLDFNQDKPKSGVSVTWLVGRPHERGVHDMWFDQWVSYEDKFVESIPDIRQNDPANAYLGYSIPVGEWHNYVIVYDSKAENPLGVTENLMGENVPLQGEVTLYVDGFKTGGTYYCLCPQNAPTKCNWLGRSRFAPDPYFVGSMDEFRLYDRVLSEEEISRLAAMR